VPASFQPHRDEEDQGTQPKKDKEEAEELEGEEAEGRGWRKFYLLSVQVSEFVQNSVEEISGLRENLEKAATPKTPRHPLTRHLASLLKEITEDLSALVKEEEGEEGREEAQQGRRKRTNKAQRREEGKKEMEEKDLLSEFKKNLEMLVTTVQLGIQSAKKIAEEKEVKETEEEEGTEKEEAGERREKGEDGEEGEVKDGEEKVPPTPTADVVNLFSVQNRFVRFVNGMKIPKILELTENLDRLVTNFSEPKNSKTRIHQIIGKNFLNFLKV
jgi:hypothetical protein